MNNTDILQLAIIFLLAIPLLSLVGLPIMVITGQILSILRQRSAYAKCAKQITRLSLYLGIILSIAGLVVLWLRLKPILYSLINQADSHMHGTNTISQNLSLSLILSPDPSMLHLQAPIILYLTILGASIIMGIVYILWSSWEEKRILHQSLSLVASFWYALAIYGIVCIISAEYDLKRGLDYPLSLNKLFMPSIESNFWNSAPYLLPLAFALAGGIGAVWLIIRRNIDDFGRDYYATTLKWCASWARNAWFILWLFLMGTTAIQWINNLKNENYLTSPEFLQGALFVLLWLIPGIIWTLVLRSEAPLRHKTTLLLAFVLGSCIIGPLYIGLQ